MADLSLNLEIKGIGSTNMSMDDAKKLYNELRVLFEEKVKYVPSGGWHWQYPWWSYNTNFNPYGIYGSYSSGQHPPTKGIQRRGFTGSDTSSMSAYNISV